MELIAEILRTTVATALDLAPIVAILFGFQLLAIRKPFAKMRQILIGLAYVLAGLTLFLVGLEKALFPLGKIMAEQLTDPEFLRAGAAAGPLLWTDYFWVYVFAAAIGFSTTIAEPSLMAVAIKAGDISGGAVNPTGLRIAVAIGVAAGVSIGAFRIVTGTPLHYYIIAGYVIVIIQTLRATKFIIPLAYDSGGVTTSTVTVPLVAALGIGLASTIPGRSPLIDGFGLIAFASLFPIMTVMAFADLSAWWNRYHKSRVAAEEDGSGP